jgi:cytochrome c biogenesis factor
MATASGWREDVLVSLVGWEAGGGTATVQVRLNPLTLWVWIGAGLMASGGVFCLLPRFLPRPAAALEGARDAASRAPAVALEVRS